MLLTKLSTKNPKIILPILVSMFFVIFTEANLNVPSICGINQVKLSNSANFLFNSYLIISIWMPVFTGILIELIGKKRTLMISIFIFTLGSIVSLFDLSITHLLVWKFIQRSIASMPLVAGIVLLVEQYSFRKSCSYIGIVNSFIGLGALITSFTPIFPYHFGWHSTPFIVAALSLFSLMGILLFIEEDSKQIKEQEKFIDLSKKYLPILSNFSFLCYTVISIFPLVTMAVFSHQLPALLLNQLRLSSHDYFYFQFYNAISFTAFSLLSYFIVSKRGIDFTKNFGLTLLSIGALLLLFISSINFASITLICISTSSLIAGGALIVGTFGINAIQECPEEISSSVASIFLLRNLFTALVMFFYEYTFINNLPSLILPLFLLWSLLLLWFLVLEQSKNTSSILTNFKNN